jgi:glycerol-3-phosphate dehydrogenase (NAD(P)+)
MGAAAKNVIGIASGRLDGLNYSSLKGALMARGAREIARLIKAMGGNEVTAYGLSHLGDYEPTLFSKVPTRI